jgi:transposase-like protein
MKSTRRSYTAEFKKKAVRLGKRRGVAAASRDLGIDRSLIGRWIRSLETDGERSFPGTAMRETKSWRCCREGFDVSKVGQSQSGLQFALQRVTESHA